MENGALILAGLTGPQGRKIVSFGEDPLPHVPHEKKLVEIGSVTKVFTGILLQTMIRDQLVKLDDPVVKYLPQYERALTKNGKQTTLRHLITHTSGLPKVAKNMKVKNRLNPLADYSPAKLDQFFSVYKLKKEIDAGWNYSNIGIGLLGNLLADLLGTTYEQAIKTRICQPLGMTNTGISLSEQEKEQLISVKRKNKTIPPFSLPAIEGAGALRSNMEDMLRFMEANLGLVEHPLQDDLEQTHKVHHHLGYHHSKMGMGWWITNEKELEKEVIWHGGTTIAFHTYAAILKDEQLGVVVFSTERYTWWRIIKLLLGRSQFIGQDRGLQLLKNESYHY